MFELDAKADSGSAQQKEKPFREKLNPVANAESTVVHTGMILFDGDAAKLHGPHGRQATLF